MDAVIHDKVGKLQGIFVSGNLGWSGRSHRVPRDFSFRMYIGNEKENYAVW